MVYCVLEDCGEKKNPPSFFFMEGINIYSPHGKALRSPADSHVREPSWRQLLQPHPYCNFMRDLEPPSYTTLESFKCRIMFVILSQ